jgi:hypothetical protein
MLKYKRMKKKLILMVLLLASIQSYGQKKWYSSFILGTNFSKARITEIYPLAMYYTQSDFGVGLSSGVDFYRVYSNNVFFKTGIRYMLKSNSGTIQYRFYQDSIIYQDFKANDSYINMPLMLGYLFNIKKQRFMLSTGIELNYLFYINSTYDTNHVKEFSSGNYNITPKFVISASYLYKFNERFSFYVSPEYSQSKMIDDYTDFGDYLIEWRLNLGIIFGL